MVHSTNISEMTTKMLPGGKTTFLNAFGSMVGDGWRQSIWRAMESCFGVDLSTNWLSENHVQQGCELDEVHSHSPRLAPFGIVKLTDLWPSSYGRPSAVLLQRADDRAWRSAIEKRGGNLAKHCKGSYTDIWVDPALIRASRDHDAANS